jgi:phosphoglycerate kinase
MRYLSKVDPKNLRGKACLLRLDFNTEDNWRMEACAPTIKFLAKNCKATVILSHKGRPSGYDKSLSLRSLRAALHKLIGREIVFVPHFRFLEIKDLISASPAGSVFLLENLRFLDGEAENNPVLAEHLASLGDIYVNDAFAVSHRANASVVTITKFLKSYAGLKFEEEIRNLSRAMTKPAKPLVVILGGAKIEDKLQVYENLKKLARRFLIGGALDEKILKSFRDKGKILLPVDFKKSKGVIKDIGTQSVKMFEKEIKSAETIIWNGPVGDIRYGKFSGGTKAVAKVVSGNKKSFKVVGGGETVMFLKRLKLDKKIDFVSTGGGAMLEFLAGKKLPGIEALK